VIEKLFKLAVSAEKGSVSAVFCQPESASALLVLGHGAGAGMHHHHMESLSAGLTALGIATLRYNFPFMESGRKGRDSRAITLQTINAAVSLAEQISPLPCYAGGHSFGGRMTSLAQAESPLKNIRGLIFFSFPLHPPGKPATDRTAHFANIDVPMLFVSGTRDKLAELSLLKQVTSGLRPTGKVHCIDTADHSFSILKRSRKSKENVYNEAARTVYDWIAAL
jgi:predicted alpha/beta-hydrolase family hydrolase